MTLTVADRPAAASQPRDTAPAFQSFGAPLLRGAVGAWLTVIVLLPLFAVAVAAFRRGPVGFWTAVSNPQTVAALSLSFGAAFVVVIVNMVTGTLIAWVMVRDNFPGKPIVDALIDLPFALPTIVAGLTLIALYGPKSPIGINVAYTRAGIVLALLFVTLPFVIRSVQPVLEELDQEMEEAAFALGASGWTAFRLVILPNLLPAILSGAGLAFAKAIGEFGSVVLISGNIPFRTEVGAVNIFNQIENDNVAGAAAISVVLLGMSIAMLIVIALIEQRGARHDLDR